MTTYQETLDFLFSRLPMFQRQGGSAYKKDLTNILALTQAFGHPHRHFKSIHIAGTNGKGSTSHMLASILQMQGYKVGLYTSPHLKDFRERIKVNGQPVDTDFVVDFVNRIMSLIENIQPSFFEITVFMAFEFFREQAVDIAIIETGLGGRLDSTNIVAPILSIITNIGLDHTAFLGDTPDKIAGEKAGIIKKKTPVVVGQKDPKTLPVFEKKARQEAAPLLFAEDFFSCDYAMQSVDGFQIFNVKKQHQIIYPQLKLDLLGIYQRYNLRTVLTAIEVLNQQSDLNISQESIYSGLQHVVKNTGLLGRWQIVSYNPTIVLDVAHNLDGLSAVFQQVAQTPYQHLHIVTGFVNDKNIETILPLFPPNATYYFCKANVPRALSLEQLLQYARQYHLQGEAYSSVQTAYNTAVQQAGVHDLVLVTGSTFVVAEVV